MNTQLFRRLALNGLCYIPCLLLLAAQAEGGEVETSMKDRKYDSAISKMQSAVRHNFTIDREYADVVNTINEKMVACKPFVFQHHETYVDPEQNKAEIQFLSEYRTPKLIVSVEAVGEASSQVEVFAVSERSQCIAAIESVRRGVYGETGCP